MRATREDKVINLVVGVFMALVLIVTIYPLYYAFIGSFNDADDIAKNGFVYLFPRMFTLDNYRIVFTENTLLRAFAITAARTVAGTLVSVIFTAIVAYPLSRRYLLFRKVYIRIGVITMYFFGGIIPFYLTLRSLHLLDSFLVYIFPMMFSFFNAVIFISFFSGIPDALEESAKLDGANDWRIFWNVVFPLSMPVVATIAMFNGVAQNSWFDAAFYTTSGKLDTLQLVLYNIISQAEGAAMASRFLAAGKTNVNIIDAIKYATMVVSIVPISLVYPFLQKYYVKGMMMGSIKE